MPPPAAAAAALASARLRNGALAAGLAAFGIACGLAPLLYARAVPRNLYAQEGPLSGSAVSRGPFLNSGSRDVGADPDWQGGVWRGARSGGGGGASSSGRGSAAAGADARGFAPSDEALAAARARLDAARASGARA